jgi:hypothetical protein
MPLCTMWYAWFGGWDKNSGQPSELNHLKILTSRVNYDCTS